MTPSTILKRAATAALLACPLAVGGAQAQIQGNAPVQIDADEADAINAEGVVTYRGSVEVLQEQTRLRCSEMRIQFSRTASTRAQAGVPANWGDVQRINCSGPVYYVTPTQNARGDSAVYEAGPEIITLIGNVVITQGQNVATTPGRAIINTRTNNFRLEADARGTGSNRVRTVLYPESTGGAPARGAAPAAPASPAAPGQ
jgi:lipopolysaccharide export system protein LptA